MGPAEKTARAGLEKAAEKDEDADVRELAGQALEKIAGK